jgi:hypothetical protein
MGKLDLGITKMHPNKPRTLEQLIEYRNEIVLKAAIRSKDPGYNYYSLRLKEIDQQFPQFKGMGRIVLK